MREQSSVAEEHGKKRTMGLLGVVLGLIGLGVAVIHFWAGPFEAPPPLEETIAEKAVDIRNAVVAKLKGEQPQYEKKHSEKSIDQVVTIASVVFGFLAIALGVISFIQREDLRVSGSAAALGAATIAFQYLVVALAALVFAIILAAVLGSLGFS